MPPCDGAPFLTDGGIETTLIFHYGLDLPAFASFPLLDSGPGQAALRRYFQTYTDLARRLRLGLVLESPTWRASPSWAAQLGYPVAGLASIQHRSIAMMEEFRRQMDAAGLPSLISGNLGPRGDGYVVSSLMTAGEAEAYHRPQVEAFTATEADLVCALTLNYVEEAIGIAQAARTAAMPVVLSFTVETDGRLPTGETLQRAIESTDAATDGYPSYYMSNCAHPTHLLAGVGTSGPWRARVRGVRANASSLSHAELNDSTELDAGDPEDFGALHSRLKSHFPSLCVIGGCCGTDERHVEEACRALGPGAGGRDGPPVVS
ncbi:MAG: homocysteine S-methyltransferase family protein [Gemmatimonadales bacterium]